MATKRRRKTKSRQKRRSRRKSCKYGKLKRPTKTKSGRKRKCKKKKRKSKRRKKKSKRRKKRKSKFTNCSIPSDLRTCRDGRDIIDIDDINTDADVNDYVQFNEDKRCTSRENWDQWIRNFRQHKTIAQNPATKTPTWCSNIYPENANQQPRQNDSWLTESQVDQVMGVQNQGGDDFMEGIQQDYFQGRDNLPNVISDPNVGNQGNLQTFEFGENWALNDIFSDNYDIQFSMDFFNLLLGGMMMSSELSNVSRCTKLLMIWCLDMLMYQNPGIDGEMNLWYNWIKPNNYANLIDLVNKCKTVLQDYFLDPYIPDPQLISVDVGQATGLAQQIEYIEINAELVYEICQL